MQRLICWEKVKYCNYIVLKYGATKVDSNSWFMLSLIFYFPVSRACFLSTIRSTKSIPKPSRTWIIYDCCTSPTTSWERSQQTSLQMSSNSVSMKTTLTKSKRMHFVASQNFMFWVFFRNTSVFQYLMVLNNFLKCYSCQQVNIWSTTVLNVNSSWTICMSWLREGNTRTTSRTAWTSVIYNSIWY